ncbi:hypothetical protein LCGC14_0484800 [marine sediment metagenome]|uniref:Uncharacterized protein n=1 Tax=marine sediment metagenome TaxID=412755 RepID=A0A0F9SRG6_9ZZZZ
MVNLFLIVYGVAVISIFLNLLLGGSVFVFGDLRRYVKMWYKQRFKYKKTEMIEAMMLQPNKTITRDFYKIDGKGVFKTKKDDDASYALNTKRIMMNEGGFPTGVWEVGNGTQLDLYKVSGEDSTSAHLQDAAIKMALAAQSAGELFKLLESMAKMSRWTFIGVLVMSGVLALAVVILFQMAGDVSVMTGSGPILV